ncbi:MAG: TonB-dependent receptor [Parabacteroides sp.]|nr:TonB-dependent receptor [Parabacteroides sp.]
MKNGGDPDLLEGNTDWYKEFLRSAALQHSHNVSLAGGSDRITYLASLGYMSQDDIIPNSSYERYNLRINTTAKVTSWFKLGVNLTYLNGQETDTTGDADDIDGDGGSFKAFQRVGRAVPYMPVKYSDGTWSYLSAPTNPVRMVTDDYGRRIKNNNNISALISPEFNLVEGLNIKGIFAYESSSYRNKQFNKTVDYKSFEPAGQSGTNVVARNKQMDKWEQWNNLTASATMNYEKQIDAHYFKVMAGGSLETFKWAYTKASRRDFPNNNFSEINAGDPNTASAEGNSTKSALASVFGRLNYSFAERYLIEANLRYDGSSKFAKGNRFGLFPSFSVGWRISEEAFLKM